MQTERRERRSKERYRALELQFAALRESGDAQHIALADGDGLLLGHAGDERRCEALACQVAEKYRHGQPATREAWEVTENLATISLTDGAQTLFLGVISKHLRPDRISSLAQSVQRIFAERR